MVPKSGVGKAWEGKKRSMNKGLGASWFPSVGVLHGSQEWGGKGLGRCKMVPKSVVGSWFPRVGWEGWKLLLLEIPLVDESDRCGT